MDRVRIDVRARWWIGAGVAALALALAACGSKNPGPSAGSGTCTPSGTSLTEIAQDLAFGGNLCAPANQAFTIAFDNRDAGIQHNIEIFKDQAMTQSVFKGDIVTGPVSVDYSVPSLAAGTYHFRCDIHPTQMQGVLIVAG